MTKVLFLGGSKDGEMMDVRRDEFMQVPVIKAQKLDAHLSDPTIVAPAYEVETYKRQKLRGEAETFEVFTPADWTGDMLLRHLMDRATR